MVEKGVCRMDRRLVGEAWQETFGAWAYLEYALEPHEAVQE